ncbi:MAG: hypothetical protein ABI904_16130 [Chloroflexota bacterium]
MTESENSLESTPAETTIELISIALQAVPVAGGILSGTAIFFLDKRKNERLNKFLLNLAENLNQVQEKVNSDFIKSDEFRDLTEDVFSKASETRQQEKLDALRAVFLNTVLSKKPKYDETEEITTLIYNWQSRHIILLKILFAPLDADKQRGNIVGNGGGLTTSIEEILMKLLPDWDSDQIERTWKDLYDKAIHGTPGTKGTMSDKGIHQLESRLTEFGLKVAKYLTNPI